MALRSSKQWYTCVRGEVGAGPLFIKRLLAISRTWEGSMKLKILMCLGSAAFAGALLCAPFSGAQQKAGPAAQATVPYDLHREAMLIGTVVSYTKGSATAPIGPRATIRTSGGNVDVHLGNAEQMKVNDIFVAPGDSVRITGVMQNYGNGDIFIARVLQKGNQTVTLRSLHGIPLAPKAAGTNTKSRSILGGAQ